MDHFHHGLCNDVKDWVSTLDKDPIALTNAISLVVQCDNQPVEWHSKWKQILWAQG